MRVGSLLRRGRAAAPASGPHQLAAAALVLAVVLTEPPAVAPVVRALASIVGSAVGGAPAPEVLGTSFAAPAIAPVRAGGTPPEGGERLHLVAGRAPFCSWHRSLEPPSDRTSTPRATPFVLCRRAGG